MTIIIAEGEESMIVDMHLIAGLHVGKAKEVRIAPAIEEEDISGLGHRVEPPTGRLSAFDINTRAPTLTPFDALKLDGHRQVHRMIQHGYKHRRLGRRLDFRVSECRLFLEFPGGKEAAHQDRKSTRLNSSH